MTKGGDIASASPLVIDTDGNYFDVTGTTSFSVMTVESGNFFMLQFDGALTITHGSGIELPGAANLTTATGDRLICYATAANTVEVMSVETEAAASAGGLAFIGTTTASSSATITVTGLSTTYDNYLVIGSQLRPATDDVTANVRFGDSGGIDSGSTDYSWSAQVMDDITIEKSGATSNDRIYIMGTGAVQDVGNLVTEGFSFQGTLTTKATDGAVPKIFGTGQFGDFNDVQEQVWFQGQHNTAITMTQIQFFFASGNITSGRLTVWGYKQS
jgi:hypothetical protein